MDFKIKYFSQKATKTSFIISFSQWKRMTLHFIIKTFQCHPIPITDFFANQNLNENIAHNNCRQELLLPLCFHYITQGFKSSFKIIIHMLVLLVLSWCSNTRYIIIYIRFTQSVSNSLYYHLCHFTKILKAYTFSDTF